MSRKSHGSRVKTRKLFRKRARDKTPITRYLQHFADGEKVLIKIDSSSHSIPFSRYHGLVGTVMEHRGRAFVVGIKDGGVSKKLIIRPEHLRRVVIASRV